MIHNTFRRAILTSPILRQSCKYSSSNCPKVAVLLSGCGHLDGSEIHESVAVLSQLTRNKAVPFIFALDCKQYHVIDHAKGAEDTSHCRNIISESSRIARHPVKPLEELINEFSCYQALIVPGGFGIAKNFSNFAEKGHQMEVNPQVKQVLEMFYKEKKPIGLICIAPILAAKLFLGVRITLGRDGDKWPFRDAIVEAEKMGAIMEGKDVSEVSADYNHMIFSTPAFMYDGDYHEVDDGIGNLVKCMITQIVMKEKEKKK